MYKIGFLKPEGKYDFFAGQLKDLDNYSVDICSFDYDSLSKFNAYEYDLVIIGIDLNHFNDVEIFLENIQLFYVGSLIALDDEFSMKRKFVLSELGLMNYFYLPIDFNEFAFYLPWYINKENNLIRYKDVVLNTDDRTIKRGGFCLNLKNMEFRLIKYLLQNSGRIMSKDRILEDVWDMNSMVCSKTVEVHICRLRNKIDRGFEDKLLHTIPNTGYMLR